MGTFRRNTSADRRAIRLLGPGDPFVDALWSFSEEDDRGRAFATWRARQAWRERADLPAFCFDLRISPNIDDAVQTLQGEKRDAATQAVRRRAEAYFPPVQERVWVDRRGTEITDKATNALLDAPYNELSGDATGPNLGYGVTLTVSYRAPNGHKRVSWLRARAIEIISARQNLRSSHRRCRRCVRTEGEDAAARIRRARKAWSAGEHLLRTESLRPLLPESRSPKCGRRCGIVVLCSETIPTDELSERLPTTPARVHCNWGKRSERMEASRPASGTSSTDSPMRKRGAATSWPPSEGPSALADPARRPRLPVAASSTSDDAMAV